MEARIDIPMKLAADQKGGGKAGDEILMHSLAQAEYMAKKGLAEFVNKDDEKAAKGAYDSSMQDQIIDPHATNEAPVSEAQPGVTSTAAIESDGEETTKRKYNKKNAE